MEHKLSLGFETEEDLARFTQWLLNSLQTGRAPQVEVLLGREKT